MASIISIPSFIAGFASSQLGAYSDWEPWALTGRAEAIVRELLPYLPGDEFNIGDSVAIHRTSTVEHGAVLKRPSIIGPHCFVATGAYLRGGTWLDADCIVGPGSELKSSFLFYGTKLAHFNFVGDSILGANVNLEAGSIVANYRNERADSEISIRTNSGMISVNTRKFGALIGDDVRIGANAVIAPGALIRPRQVIPRLSLVDQEAE